MLVTTVKPPAARCYYSPRSIPERVFAAGVACASVAARRRRTSPAAMALTLARALAVHWLVRSAQLEWAHAPLSLAWDDAAAQLAQPESRFGRFAVGDDELSLHWLEVPSSTAESEPDRSTSGRGGASPSAALSGGVRGVAPAPSEAAIEAPLLAWR